MKTMSFGAVEPHVAHRFLAFARWRCFTCESPWFAAKTWDRAWERLTQHRKGCR